MKLIRLLFLLILRNRRLSLKGLDNVASRALHCIRDLLLLNSVTKLSINSSIIVIIKYILSAILMAIDLNCLLGSITSC